MREVGERQARAPAQLFGRDDAGAERPQERAHVFLLARLGRVVRRPVLRVRQANLSRRLANGRRSVVALHGLDDRLALDELDGEQVFALHRARLVVRTGALAGLDVDDVGGRGSRLARDQPLAAEALDPLVVREKATALLPWVHSQYVTN